MTYLSDKTKSNKKIFRTIFTLFLISVLSFSWIQIRSSVNPVIVPVFVSSNKILEKVLIVPYSIVNYLRSQDSLALEILNLQIRTEELENQIALLNSQISVLKDNEGVVKEDVTKDKAKSNILLYPVAQDITKIYSTILFSKGFKDGVVSDAVVYLRGRQAVCVIKDIHSDSSLCKLLSFSGNEVDGVTSITKESISLIGDGGGNYIANVPKESNFTLGESVMYKSDQTMYLGNIVDIKNDPQDTFAKVYIRGAYNPLKSNIFYVDKE